MSKFDPPSDQFGSEKSCPLCDRALEQERFTGEWYCANKWCPDQPPEMAHCAECDELVEKDTLRQDPYPVPNWLVCPKCFAQSLSLMGADPPQG